MRTPEQLRAAGGIYHCDFDTFDMPDGSVKDAQTGVELIPPAKVPTNPIYEQALLDAMDMMDMDCEPRSALKQAASDHGIAYGDDMGAFVDWAEARLYAPR